MKSEYLLLISSICIGFALARIISCEAVELQRLAAKIIGMIAINIGIILIFNG